MTFFKQMMNSRDSSVSSSRFLAVVTILTILYVWAWLCIYARAMVEIPPGVYAFAAIVVTGSVGNKFADRKSPGSTSEITTKTSTEGV